MEMLKRAPLKCSFCGKDETQVAKLVAGPKVHICDACIAAARRIMESSADGDTTPKLFPTDSK
jgi:ATP-dependent Clp protease ATP-binding subunit ClpX